MSAMAGWISACVLLFLLTFQGELRAWHVRFKRRVGRAHGIPAYHAASCDVFHGSNRVHLSGLHMSSNVRPFLFLCPDNHLITLV